MRRKIGTAFKLDEQKILPKGEVRLHLNSSSLSGFVAHIVGPVLVPIVSGGHGSNLLSWSGLSTFFMVLVLQQWHWGRNALAKSLSFNPAADPFIDSASTS